MRVFTFPSFTWRFHMKLKSGKCKYTVNTLYLHFMYLQFSFTAQLYAKVVEDYPGEPPRQPQCPHGSARHAMRARVAEFYSVNARSPPSSRTAARASPQRERRRLSALDQFIPKVRGPDRRTRRARARQKMSTQIGRQGVQ